MKKTIWYLTKYFSTGSTGSVGTRSWLILKKFAELGEQVVVVTSDSNHLSKNLDIQIREKHQKIDGIHIIWLRTFKYSIAKSFFRILSWIHFEWNLFWLRKSKLPNPDIIIVSSLSLFTILNGLLLKRKYKCKLVFEIRDIWPLTLTEEGGYSGYNLMVIILGLIEYWGYKKADLIVGTMPNLGEHVNNILGYEKTVICIPMVVDPNFGRFHKKISEKYIESYLNNTFFNIVYAGTIGITNALETLFKAAEILTNNVNIRFIIVGDGALRERFRLKYGHLPNVVFAPKVDKDQVFPVLSNADLVYFSVFNSKVWLYGQSLNKMIDYMLSGKPILGSYSGYQTMINESGCGYYVPAEDVSALVRKIKEIKGMTVVKRNSIGLRGRQWLLENRTVDKVAKIYLESLSKICPLN